MHVNCCNEAAAKARAINMLYCEHMFYT